MTPPAVHLVSGAAGFVGRNLVQRLLSTTPAYLVLVDDLSVGLDPTRWLPTGLRTDTRGAFTAFGDRVAFYRGDIRHFLRRLQAEPQWLHTDLGLPTAPFADVFHFAAVVGGRAKIEGDPMAVAQDLAIDAEFFDWVVRHRPARVLYPSSSAAYPIDLQGTTGAIALKETDIRFDSRLGQPDMTYGWSKLTGEYLAQIAARHYGIATACVRPFSGYGEDQDLSYPIPAIAARAARRENPFQVWGTGQQGRDFVHIDDCIDLILLALDRIADGSAVNIGSGRLTSFLEIIELMTGFAGYRPTIEPLLDKPVGVHARYADTTHLAQAFGWQPRIGLAEGMRRVYDAALGR